MGLRRGNIKSEDFEWISNRDLVDSAHMLMGEIDLDPASSAFANPYVGAKNYYNHLRFKVLHQRECPDVRVGDKPLVGFQRAFFFSQK